MTTDSIPPDLHETPDGLHRMQYAIHILELVLGWPSKGNAELLADCILSISKSRKISIQKAHDYMVRAIRLAKEQSVAVDRFFFLEGKYTLMRPEKETGLPLYTRIDREAVAREQSTPEWQEANTRLRAAFAKWAGKTAVP